MMETHLFAFSIADFCLKLAKSLNGNPACLHNHPPIPHCVTMCSTPHKSPRPGLHLRRDLGSLTHVTQLLAITTTLNRLYDTIREPHDTDRIKFCN